MSKNIDQVFIANPITVNAGTDLMYFGQSPYGAGNDAAMTYANFSAQFGAPYTASALTSVSDTNVTLTLGGTPATALLHAASITAGWSGQLSLARGGSNANLTASNGGIVYSTASAMAILAGTATAGLPLLSASSSAPTWGAFALSLGGALTTAGALTTVGAFGVTFTFTNTTSVTFPTSGTLATTSQLPTPAALTSGNDTNVTLTLGGTPATALLQATSITAGWAGQLSLARGGTNANLTASNGGIFYSTASAGAILAGTATANQVLLSGSSTTPAWSTATYPATTTINQILYSSAANTIAGITAANSGVLVSSGTGVPSMLAAGTTGQVLQASTAGTPSWSTPTYPSASGSAGVILRSNGTNNAYSTSTFSDTYSASNILYSNGANTVTGLATANGGVLVTSNTGVPSILAGPGTTGTVLQATASGTPAWSSATYPASTTINQILYSSAANIVGGITTANNSILQTNGSGVPSFSTSLPSGTAYISTVDQASASVTLAVNTQYVTDNGASLVTYTLPTTCAIGSTFIILGKSSGGWKVAQSTGQQIQVGSTASTSGATGSIASSNQWDCVVITCVTANNTFVCYGVQGNLTVV